MRPNKLSGGSFSIASVTALDPAAPPDLYLISTQEPRDGAEPSDDITADELRSSLRRVRAAELPFAAATALRSTVGNSRRADAYRAGHVFLAGDDDDIHALREILQELVHVRSNGRRLARLVEGASAIRGVSSTAG